jgi:hypothetical protein
MPAIITLKCQPRPRYVFRVYLQWPDLAALHDHVKATDRVKAYLASPQRYPNIAASFP